MSEQLQKLLAEKETELEAAKDRIRLLEAQVVTDKAQENETQQRLIQRLEGMHRLDLAMLSAESLQDVANTALRHVLELVPVVRLTIATTNLEKRTVRIVSMYSKFPTVTVIGDEYPISDVYFSAIASQSYVIIDHMEKSSIPGLQQLYQDGIRTILIVPLRAHGDTVGLLNLHSVETTYFTSEMIDIILEVAAQIALAMHSSILVEKLARYAQRMEILHALDLGLLEGGPIKNLIGKTLQYLRKLVPCERIGIGIIDHPTQQVIVFSSTSQITNVFEDGFQIPIPPNWFDGFDTKGTRLIEDMRLLDDPTYQRLAKEGFVSQFQVLMQAEKRNMGIIGFSSTNADFFNADYQQIALEVGNQLSIALRQLELSQKLQNQSAELEQRVIERTLELQTSKNQIEAILYNSLDGILLIDHDLEIIHANPAVGRLLAVDVNPDQTKNLLDLIHPDDVPYVRSSIELAMDAPMPAPIEVRARQEAGSNVHTEFSIAYIPGDGMVSTIHDITARKEAEETLKQALKREQELVEAKTRFVSVVSHEFRTPLSAIMMSSETLSAYWERMDSDKIIQKLKKISEMVIRMRDLMDDTLQLTKIQSGRFEFRPEPTDLDALCRETIEELDNQQDDRKRMVYNSQAAPLQVMLDLRLMRQVITNLFTNALKYSPADKLVSISLHREGDKVVLSVADSGIGIPGEDLQHLFEPFHRGSNTDLISGTGLGLSITKQIIEVHKGQIKVDSQVGQGTTFTVTIPDVL